MSTEILLKVTAGKTDMGQYKETTLYVPICNISYFHKDQGDRFTVELKTGIALYEGFNKFTATIPPDILKKLVLNG